jgi:hypothetical protein
MSEFGKTKCNGGCGREKEYGEPDVGGYGLYHRDHMVEWVCDECWRKGVRTTASKGSKTGE